MNKLAEQDGKSLNIVNENLMALKAIFPEAFTEDGVDFEVLRQLLGDTVDEGEEKYGLTWHGKKKARQIALTPSLGTLRPCKEESVDWDTTQNLFIEGDNLEVLKLLQKSYANKVKMIYIDPPYNTGNDKFIYPDKFSETKEEYPSRVGTRDENGYTTREGLFRKNSSDNGHYNSNWLSMMYSRLFLARNLLREDGVIFVSIDDNEVHNLRLLLNEVFGEGNFITNIVREKRFTRNNDAKLMSSVIDHILLFRKNEDVSILREPRTEKTNSIYSNPDNEPRSLRTGVSYVSQRTKEQRPNLFYKIKIFRVAKKFSSPLRRGVQKSLNL